MYELKFTLLENVNVLLSSDLIKFCYLNTLEKDSRSD